MMAGMARCASCGRTAARARRRGDELLRHCAGCQSGHRCVGCGSAAAEAAAAAACTLAGRARAWSTCTDCGKGLCTTAALRLAREWVRRAEHADLEEELCAKVQLAQLLPAARRRRAASLLARVLQHQSHIEHRGLLGRASVDWLRSQAALGTLPAAAAHEQLAVARARCLVEMSPVLLGCLDEDSLHCTLALAASARSLGRARAAKRLLLQVCRATRGGARLKAEAWRALSRLFQGKGNARRALLCARAARRCYQRHYGDRHIACARARRRVAVLSVLSSRQRHAVQ